MTKTYSLLTKTFRGDYEPFARLCESIDRFMPEARHYVLLDKSDLALFAPFASPHRILVDCSNILPRMHEFTLLGRRIWWLPFRRLIRGWIYQQLAKIEFVRTLEEDAIVLVDSDALFVQPLRPEHIFSEGKVRLFHNPGVPSGPTTESDKWHNVALRSFGLEPTGYTGFDYISQAVIWAPAIVRALVGKIESVNARNWIDVLLDNFRFSEYVLYGVFCERVEGEHRQMILPTEDELSHCSWHYDLATTEGVDHFVDSIRSDQVAVLIQSNLRLSAEMRADIIERFHARAGAAMSAG